jgi:hypothetical protein
MMSVSPATVLWIAAAATTLVAVMFFRQPGVSLADMPTPKVGFRKLTAIGKVLLAIGVAGVIVSFFWHAYLQLSEMAADYRLSIELEKIRQQH